MLINDGYTFNQAIKPTIEYIGNDQYPVLIFDDIAVNPEYLIEQYHQIKENEQAAQGTDNFYPGKHVDVDREYAANLYQLLKPYIKEYFKLPAAYLERIFSDFSIVDTPEEQLTLLQSIPHYDSYGEGHLAVLHYLCDPPYLGTGFYRHKTTNIELITRENAPRYQKAVEQEISSSFFKKGYITGDVENFELIAQVPAKLNRLVMYRSQALHSALIDPTLVTKPIANGRLTLRSFLFF